MMLLPRALLFAASTLLLLQYASATCDPTKVCEVTFKGPDGDSYNYAFHDLCQEDDYVFPENKGGHIYNAQICGNSAFNCLPAGWENNFQYGVAVQSWGGMPSCTGPAAQHCTDKVNGQANVCCSKDCQVLGEGHPVYTLQDPSNPKTGGIKISHTNVATPPTDLYTCPIDPKTGEPGDRIVHYYMHCDLDVTGPAKVMQSVDNTSYACEYELHFATAHACGNYGEGLSAGMYFFLIVILPFLLYLIIFGSWNYYKTRRIEMPHKRFWVSLCSYIYHGALYIFTCGRVSPGPNAHPPADKPSFAGASSSGSTYQGTGPAAATASSKATPAAAFKGSSYTEL